LFATNDYINTAGGKGKEYYTLSNTLSLILPNDAEDGLKSYHVLSKPTALIPTGEMYFEGAKDSLQNHALISAGTAYDVAMSNNLWTYKNFSYGYHKTYYPALYIGPSAPPQLYPVNWDDDYFIESLDITNVDDLDIKIFHFPSLGNTPFKGHYIVLGEIGSHAPAGLHPTNPSLVKRFTRGFWEVIPERMVSSVENLKQQIMANNPSSHFVQDVNGNYKYKLTSTGETITLSYEVHDDNGQGIVSIQNPQGVHIPLSTYGAPLDNLESIPLLEVWESNENYSLTGYKYAEVLESGRIIIRNPHLGQFLDINSSDYKNPISTASVDVDAVGNLQFTNGGNGLRIGAGGNVRQFAEETVPKGKPLNFTYKGETVLSMYQNGTFDVIPNFKNRIAGASGNLRFANQKTGVTVELTPSGDVHVSSGGSFQPYDQPTSLQIRDLSFVGNNSACKTLEYTTGETVVVNSVISINSDHIFRQGNVFCNVVNPNWYGVERTETSALKVKDGYGEIHTVTVSILLLPGGIPVL
jgi:hypothetical protein